MRRCEYCGAEIKDGEKRCTHCGAPAPAEEEQPPQPETPDISETTTAAVEPPVISAGSLDNHEEGATSYIRTFVTVVVAFLFLWGIASVL